MLQFVKAHSFALLTTVQEGMPQATHLPLVVKATAGGWQISGHMAAGNLQGRDLDGAEVLVVFSGPHAYISPRHYNRKQAVPTWNYVAVHARGKARIVTHQEEGFRILEELIQQEEPHYKLQWQQLPPEYREGLYRGIIPFTIEVTEIEGVQKLSQDKSIEEQHRIAASLSGSDDTAIRETGLAMQKLLSAHTMQASGNVFLTRDA